MSQNYEDRSEIPPSAVKPIIVEENGDGTFSVRAETYGGDVVSQGTALNKDGVEVVSKVHARAAMRYAEKNNAQVHTDVVRTARTRS